MNLNDGRKNKFIIVSRALVEDLSLSHKDKVVYMIICMYINNDTGKAFPSTLTVAKKAGTSRSGVFRSLKALEDAGYIVREQRISENGQNKLTNIYHIVDK